MAATLVDRWVGLRVELWAVRSDGKMGWSWEMMWVGRWALKMAEQMAASMVATMDDPMAPRSDAHSADL